MNTRYPYPSQVASPLVEESKQRAQIVRYLCQFTGVLVAVYGIVFYLVSGEIVIMQSAFIFSVLFFSILLLNSKANYRITGFLLQVVFCTVLVYYGIVLGSVAQVQYLSIFLISISALLYKPDDKILIYCSAILPVIGLFFLEFNYNYQWTIPIAFTQEQNKVFRWLILIVVIFLNFLLVQLHHKKIVGLLNNAREVYYELALSNESLKIQAEGLEKEVKVRTEELSKLVLQLQSANHFKSAFLQESNHEVRNPVNSIIGFSEMLLKHRQEPYLSKQQEEELLECIFSSSHFLQNMVSNVLDFSKIEAGKQIELFNESFDIRDWLEQSIKIYEVLSREKGIVIHWKIDDSVPATIVTDKTRLTQILYNLLGNALKFTPRQKGIYIRCWREHEFLVLKVRDEGEGIPGDQLSSIFDDFETNYRYGGTGLGLGIVKKLVVLFKGDIDVHSTAGEGTLFRVRVPVFPATP
jgi:signal transduction histidine kinase